jgi:hypothetical protein
MMPFHEAVTPRRKISVRVAEAPPETKYRQGWIVEWSDRSAWLCLAQAQINSAKQGLGHEPSAAELERGALFAFERLLDVGGPPLRQTDAFDVMSGDIVLAAAL